MIRAEPARQRSTSRLPSVTTQILIGLALGIVVGADAASAAALVQNQQHGWDIFLHLFPTSVVDAMARGDILQIVVFSTFFGVAIAALGKRGAPVLEVLDSTAHVMFKVTGYVMF